MYHLYNSMYGIVCYVCSAARVYTLLNNISMTSKSYNYYVSSSTARLSASRLCKAG